jgi:hypothetical protein
VRIASIVSAVVLGAASFSTSPSHAAYIVRDSFTVGDGTGTAGAPVNGVAAESTVTGAVNWVANTDIKFQSGGYIQRSTLGVGNVVATVPLTPGSGPTYTLTAKVLPQDSGVDSPAFIGLGFTDSTDLQPFWSPGGSELWIYLSETGGYEVYANSTATSLSGVPGADPAPLFFPGQFNELKLIYNTVANQLTAEINGVTVVNAANLGAFVPNIGGAGFFMYANEAGADDFVAAVPEPAAAGILAALGAVMLRRRTRN